MRIDRGNHEVVLEFGLKSCFVNECLKAIFYHMTVFFQPNTAANWFIKPGNNSLFCKLKKHNKTVSDITQMILYGFHSVKCYQHKGFILRFIS